MIKLKNILFESKKIQKLFEASISIYGNEDQALDMMLTGQPKLEGYKVAWSAEKAQAYLTAMGGGDIEAGKKEFVNRVNKLGSIKPPSGAPKRIDMPVITSAQVEEVQQAIINGEIDVYGPYANNPAAGKGSFDKDQFSDSGADTEFLNKKDFLTKGKEDGEEGGNADALKSKDTNIAASMLKPSQSAIYLEKAVGGIFGGVGDQARKGTVSGMNPNDIIVVKGNYILDGHHRWASAMLANPTAKLEVTYIDLPIQIAIPVLRTVGNALGNKGQA